jgi:Fe-S cluster biosynthesis and repair protein YggX
MELFKNFGTMKITEAKLREMIKQSLNEQLEEGKIGRTLAGLGLAATLATSMPSCSYFNHYEPNWEQEGPRSEQEKMGKTWNTHEERGDWDNIEPGVGFIYDCYTRCANSGGGWNIHVIFKDKTTGKFILPQECQEYLCGRYVPNCNCFENEKTTDRVDTNGLQRLSGSENTTVFENKQNTNISKNTKKQTIKLNESQLRNIIRESVQKILKEEYEDYYNDTKDLYFRLDDPDPYNAEKLLRQIQGDLESNFININGVFELAPVNEKKYEYKIPNLSYDEYEDVYNFLSDTYHDELWIEE